MAKRQTKLGDIVKEFMTNSSAHGLSNIYESTNLVARILWIILFLGGVGVVIWQVTMIFITYIGSPFHVDMELVFQTNLEFPSVTVCNVNPVRRTKLEASDDQFRSFFDTNFEPPEDGEWESDDLDELYELFANYFDDETDEEDEEDEKLDSESSANYYETYQYPAGYEELPADDSDVDYSSSAKRSPTAASGVYATTMQPTGQTTLSGSSANYSADDEELPVGTDADSDADYSSSATRSPTSSGEYATTMQPTGQTTLSGSSANYSAGDEELHVTSANHHETYEYSAGEEERAERSANYYETYEYSAGDEKLPGSSRDRKRRAAARFAADSSADYSSSATGSPTTSRENVTTMQPTGHTTSQMTTDEEALSWEERESSRQFFETISDDYKMQQMLINLLANKTLEERMELGHQLEDMLLTCEWKGFPCSPSNFTSFYHYKYGNCYTFNSNMFNNGAKLSTSKPGPLYGLALEMNVEQHEYMEGITATAGLKVVIHSPNRMPFPEDHGISISPGFETSIGVRVVDIRRLKKPWADCVNKLKHNVPYEDIFAETYGVDYSIETCDNSCFHQEVVKQCGCVHPKYSFSDNSSDISACALAGDIADAEDAECVGQIVQRHIAGELGCDCPHGCNERTFIPSMSMSRWPAAHYSNTVIEKVAAVNQYIMEDFRYKDAEDRAIFIGNNVARIQVYYQEFNYELIEQKPSYGVIDLLSNIGGQLGLWIGVSILSLLEMIQYGGVILAFIIRKMFGCEENRVKSTPVKAFQNPNRQLEDSVLASLDAKPGLLEPGMISLDPRALDSYNRSPPPSYSTSTLHC